MNLRYDPQDFERFRRVIGGIPGYPTGEELPIRLMVFESGAIWRISEYLRTAGIRPEQVLTLVMDRTPMRRERDDLKPLLLRHLHNKGWQTREIWLEPDATGQVHTDFRQIEFVKSRLVAGSAMLSVGSGTVTDIAKHACFLFQEEHDLPALPWAAYQTANSVSAYTSNMAPTFVDGVKRTLPSRYPDVLICDLETLRDAPYEMTVAGVGDLMASFGSYADWWLAHRLGLDSTYTDFAQTLMGPLDEIFLHHAEGIRSGGLESVSVLAKLIALAGLAMSLSHATAPLSGFEHVISHVLDLIAEREQRPLAQHGTQVALATRLTTAAYSVFMNDFEPAEVRLQRCYPTESQMRTRLEMVFGTFDPSGRVAAECWSDYQHKLQAWHAQRSRFEDTLRNWPAVQAQLHALVKPPSRVDEILTAISAPLHFSQLTPPPAEEEVRFAFTNAPLIRRRFTLGDLFVFLNWDQGMLWERAGQNL